MQKITNPGDTFDCLNQLGFAFVKSLYVYGKATQEQHDYAARISNCFYDAVQKYKERLGGNLTSWDAYAFAAVEHVRQGVALIESKDGKAFMEQLPVPSRVIVETIALFATSYLPIKD